MTPQRLWRESLWLQKFSVTNREPLRLQKFSVKNTVLSLPFSQQIQFTLIVNVVNLNEITNIKESSCTTKQEEGKLRSKCIQWPPSRIWAFQVSGLPQLLRVSLMTVYTWEDHLLDSLKMAFFVVSDTWLQIFQNDSKICEAGVTVTPLINKICKPWGILINFNFKRRENSCALFPPYLPQTKYSTRQVVKTSNF